MNIYHADRNSRSITQASEDAPLQEGCERIVGDEALSAWVAALPSATIAYAEKDYSDALDRKIHAIAQACRYSSIESMRSYAGFDNPYREECLPFAKWSALLWKKVDELQAAPREGTPPTPEEFANLVFSLVPPPSFTR